MSLSAVAVYLGTLATAGTSLHSSVGALLGYLGIFLPGLILHTATVGIWKTMRKHRWVTALLRGINASAVGLVYTAVYRLWRIGYINEEFTNGSSLDADPWLVVITATSFVGGMWFNLTAPTAILLGGVMGMIWYAIVR
jgi:chromate transport protein ChrA